MKIIATKESDEWGNPEVVSLWRLGGDIWIEAPSIAARMSRDNVEQLIAELESLLRED